MPDATARLSVALTAQVRDNGTFPSMQTYPASVERFLTGGKAFAVTGTATSAGVSVPVSGTLATITVWYVEAAGGSVTIAGGPVNSTVPAGESLLATNAVGWTAGTVTLSGSGTYKLICYGA